MKQLGLHISLLLVAFCISAQPVLLEKMVQAEELLCFPVYGDSTTFKYLPSEAGLTIKEGKPEFSFMQYAIENESNTVSASSITKALGGGLINFLVSYTTPESKIRKAERELQKLYQREDIKLVGPVEIAAAKFMLISSTLIGGKEQRELIGSGRAPIFQNSKVAFSFMLTREKATLLMESFKMKTPDISITFDLEFKGLTNGYNGRLTVDWGQVQNSSYAKSTANAVFYTHQLESTYKGLHQSGAIKLESYGTDSLSSSLMEIIYDKLTKVMYEPIAADTVPIIDAYSNPLGGSSTYRRRTFKRSGHTIVELNSKDLVSRHHLVTFNIGDLYKEHGDNKAIFKKVALDEDLFKQREITVTVDGDLKADFAKMVNSVSVTLKKDHTNGAETVKEVFFDADKLKSFTGPVKLTYMNKEDTDKGQWLEYNYVVDWAFKKDGDYQTEWQKASGPIINLYAPYKFHEIDLLGDIKQLKADNIIAVIVQIEYPFFGRTKNEKQIIKPFNEENESSMTAIIPMDLNQVDYKMTWVYKDGKKITKEGVDDIGVILIDEIPTGE